MVSWISDFLYKDYFDAIYFDSYRCGYASEWWEIEVRNKFMYQKYAVKESSFLSGFFHKVYLSSGGLKMAYHKKAPIFQGS